MTIAPHQFWQQLAAAGTYDTAPAEGFAEVYPATLPDGRQVLLPIRVLPGGEDQAVASLILNQASFVLEDALADALTAKLKPFAPQVVIGVPTLGLPLAHGVARRLGHPRMVALGTSRKFWYRDELSEPLSSITTPGHSKRIYLDPRMLPLLENRRVALIDDVISTGSSLSAVLRLLAGCGIEPVVIGCAMLQSRRWEAPLAPWQDRILGVFATPRLVRAPAGGWHPEAQEEA